MKVKVTHDRLLLQGIFYLTAASGPFDFRCLLLTLNATVDSTSTEGAFLVLLSGTNNDQRS